MTPLHWAVKRNYVQLAEILIRKGAYKDCQDILGRTPLHIASKLGYFEMVQVCILKLNMIDVVEVQSET